MNAERTYLAVCQRLPWPMDHGASVRTGSLLEAVSRRVRLVVFAGVMEGAELDPGVVPSGVEMHAIRLRKPTRGMKLGVSPVEGLLARPVVDSAFRYLQRNPQISAALWENSNLVPRGGLSGAYGGLHSVEFANRESTRYMAQASSSRGLRRLGLMLEALKSMAHEPHVARKAGLAVSLAHDEHRWLGGLGARCVMIPNGMHPARYTPSVACANRILAVGSWDYEPNRDGMNWFLRNEWPRILAKVPDAKLDIAGKESNCLQVDRDCTGVELKGYVNDLADLYRGAAVCLAPARTGAGSQLKVADAVAHGRVTVGPLLLQREIATGYPRTAVLATADIAGVVVSLLSDAALRHSGEAAAATHASRNTWDAAAERLCQAVDNASS